MNARPDAPATGRNRDAILEVLRREFGNIRSVLEIGSGTGQHAVFFGQELKHIRWQTSDRRENHAGINAWLADAELGNVTAPLDLDVDTTTSVAGTFDAVFSANTAHIMHFDSVTRMFQLVGKTLQGGGIFCLYGPFKLNGEFTSDSNRLFDQSLRSTDPGMGIRDLEELDRIAEHNELRRSGRYAMPANNMVVLWRKKEKP